MPDWKLRRGDSEWPIESIAMLQEWATSGRVTGSDYVFNPILEKWMYAEEVIELRALIANTGHSRKPSSAQVATSGAAVPRKTPLAIGIIIVVVGIALIIISPQLSFQRAYSFSTPGGPTMSDWATDATYERLAFVGGIVLLVIGGILSAVGVSQSTASK